MPVVGAVVGVTASVTYGDLRPGHGITLVIAGQLKAQLKGVDTCTKSAPRTVPGVLDVHGDSLWGAIPGGSIAKNMLLPLSVEYKCEHEQCVSTSVRDV